MKTHEMEIKEMLQAGWTDGLNACKGLWEGIAQYPAGKDFEGYSFWQFVHDNEEPEIAAAYREGFRSAVLRWTQREFSRDERPGARQRFSGVEEIQFWDEKLHEFVGCWF